MTPCIMVVIFLFGDFINLDKDIFFISKTVQIVGLGKKQSQQVTSDLYFHTITAFLCSHCYERRAPTEVVEALFYSRGTERSVLL